jgi:hypothetical protein
MQLSHEPKVTTEQGTPQRVARNEERRDLHCRMCFPLSVQHVQLDRTTQQFITFGALLKFRL